MLSITYEVSRVFGLVYFGRWIVFFYRPITFRWMVNYVASRFGILEIAGRKGGGWIYWDSTATPLSFVTLREWPPNYSKSVKIVGWWFGGFFLYKLPYDFAAMFFYRPYVGRQPRTTGQREQGDRVQDLSDSHHEKETRKYPEATRLEGAK